MTVRIVVIALLAPLALAACGGGSGGPSITVQPGQSYHLEGFMPSGPVTAGKPTPLSFTIVRPAGKPLTQYRHGAGPHNGVHVIIVRRDLSEIIHHHPPVGKDGKVSDTVTFAKPGPYRVVIDAYPKNAGAVPSFQLFDKVNVKGPYHADPTPAFKPVETEDGYRFAVTGKPKLRAAEAGLLDFTVTGPGGKPATFTPWFGALAHAIFFRTGSLDYFHTHVCAPGATGCASVLGGAKVTGTSSTPGRLKVGVLLPVGGTWRLFLQTRVHGKVVTASFTLRVA
ncbi:MAG TPA: hypothetical protein VFU10_00475 [Gaiellaceae bacterium]|nr:hypothetical protein [Gaiellaceae bacterium]